MTLNGKANEWHEVTALIIQGSVLGPNLAKCFSNSSHQGRNLHQEDKPFVSKFADDEKRCRGVKTEGQGDRMQEDINHMVVWTSRMSVQLNNDDKVEKETFWEIEEARAGAGRRRFKVMEVKRTIALQRKNVRKTSFGSKIQDPWNDLEDHVKLAKTPKAFRRAYKKSKNLV